MNGIDLHVERGSVYGILGPNGSGKTTTLGMLLGAIHPKFRKFSWFGKGTGDENRKRIGAILEHPIFYPYLSGAQNLRITARIKLCPKRCGQGFADRRAQVPERTALLLPIHWA